MVDVKRTARDDTNLKANPRIAELELENIRLELRIRELEQAIAELDCIDPMSCGRDGYICLSCELSDEEGE